MLVLIASVVSCPLAWYMAHKWPQDFAYRIEVTAWPFVVTISAVLLATLLVTFIQVFRAVRRKPADALRYE